MTVRVSKAAFLTSILLVASVGGLQFVHEIQTAFDGPSIEDRLCNDRLPGDGWDGAQQIDFEPADGTQNVTCSREIVVPLTVNVTALEP